MFKCSKLFIDRLISDCDIQTSQTYVLNTKILLNIKILHKIKKKCSFIYFVLLSHQLRWATQTETDLLIKYNEHISISRAHIQLQLFSPAFSRGSFSKTERHGSGGGMMKRGSFGSGRVGSGRVGSGRVGSGQVNAVLYPSGPKPHSSSVRPDYRAVQCTLRFTS